MAVPVWRLDVSRYPLVHASVIGGDGRTPPDLASVTRILDELAAMRGKRVIVVDLTYAVPDASRRKLLIDWTKTHWASLRGELLAVACIAPGAFQRSIITALLWFIQPSCPVETFSNREAATAWAKSALDAKGISVPSMRPPPAASP
jgi:hypothetical protein